MEHAPATRRAGPWLRPLLFGAGLVSLAVGIAGAFLPLVPTTGPVLLAAYLFARSSARFHSWLLGHRRFGPTIARFQAGGGLPLRVKVVAVVAMALSFTYAAVWVFGHPAARAAIAAVGAAAIGYVLHLPTHRTARRRATLTP